MVDEELLQKYQLQLDAAKIEAGQESLARSQQENFTQQEDRSMIKEQLDLSEEIGRIDYLIKGYSLEPGADGKLEWIKPKDNDMVIFSEYGIHLIRNTICWYLNKNLLLSNFDEDTIKKKMWDLTNDLIDTIFMEYEKVFLYPSVEDCIKVLKERIDKKVEISAYAREVAGIPVDKLKLKKERFAELEDRIEKELDKIKEQIIKGKLKRYMLIVRVIQDAIHATYMRAWKGQERTTLRQHIHISETNGNNVPQMSQPKGGLFSWGKK